MTLEERRIQKMCERAFRRGFSHGFLVGCADGDFDAAKRLGIVISGEKVTPQEVSKWRLSKDKRMIIPPGMPDAGKNLL